MASAETSTPLLDELRELKRAVDVAADAFSEAKTRRDHERYDGVRDAARPLIEFAKDVDFKRPPARDLTPQEVSERERELTAELFEVIAERGYALRVLDRMGPAVFEIVDDSVGEGVLAAEATLAEARDALATFKRDNATGLASEAVEAEATATREAVESGDPDRIRDALGIEGEPKKRRGRVVMEKFRPRSERVLTAG